MKILITGGSGIVGYPLCRKLSSLGNEVHFTYLSHECVIPGCTSHRADIAEKNVPDIPCLPFDAIIHCAALTNVDLCETNPELAWKQNVLSTSNMLRFASKNRPHFVFISTAHVFPPSERAYGDSAIPDSVLASNNYGKTKAECEKIIRNSGLDYTILRIDQPYGWNESWQRDNTVTRTLKKLKSGETVKEVSDWFNCPTFLPNFSEIVAKVLEKRVYGTYNSAGPDYISRFDWARKVAEVFGFDQNVVAPAKSESLSLAAQRPNVHLDSKTIYSKTSLGAIGICEALEIMKREFSS